LKASTEEENIVRIVLFGVDNLGKVEELLNINRSPSPTGESVTISRKIESLYAVANLDVSAETLSTVSDLTNLTSNFATAPTSPFLMSGIATNLNRTSKTVTIDLVRAVAKIEIIGEEFVIETVQVKNTPNQGYVFGKVEPLQIPSGTGFNRISYETSATPLFYVAENISSNPTVFEITGNYLGRSAVYPIVLKQGPGNVDILRNTHYRVTVTAITEDEFTIQINIPDWDDVVTDDHLIPDDLFFKL